MSLFSRTTWRSDRYKVDFISSCHTFVYLIQHRNGIWSCCTVVSLTTSYALLFHQERMVSMQSWRFLNTDTLSQLEQSSSKFGAIVYLIVTKPLAKLRMTLPLLQTKNIGYLELLGGMCVSKLGHLFYGNGLLFHRRQATTWSDTD